jgi:hypothetical protein
MMIIRDGMVLDMKRKKKVSVCLRKSASLIIIKKLLDVARAMFGFIITIDLKKTLL